MIRKEKYVLKTQELSIRTSFPISTLFAEDFLVRLFRSPDSDVDLKTPEERFSLKLPGSLGLKNLHFCSLKTFPDCCRMTEAGRLLPSSLRWMNWGTMSRGRCLTAQISALPNPERECSLSDFLESDVPERYFLSEKQIRKLCKDVCPENKEVGCIPQTD